MFAEHFSSLLSLFAFLTLSLANPLPDHPHGPSPTPIHYATFTNNTIFQSPPNYTVPGTLYARTLQLPDGSLLATWENYSPEPPPVYFPIFKSTDGGEQWSELSHVTDQVNGWGLRYQPFLYLLPTAFAGLPANSILLAGNSIPTNLSATQIDLYASTDDGLTWSFLSHIAAGGAAIPDNGIPAVWEPFLLLLDNELICFYSDQRDPAHGQKLSHQTTADLHTWSAPVDDVAYPTYTDRPGMTTVAYLPPIDAWIMTYEYGGGPIPGIPAANYSFPAYYRISSSPLTFNEAEGLPIVSQDGTHPQSSPYVTWTPAGGPNGTIVASTGTHQEVFLNRALGDVGSWEKVSTGQAVGYARSVRVLQGAPEYILLAGGGMLPPSMNNSVEAGVIDLGSCAGWWV